MSVIIEKFYEENKIPAVLLKQKIANFEKHPDIAAEFEYWIENKSYITNSCVVVEGYTAEKISKLSKYLDGEGAFMLLIELRETPTKALNKIANGFKMK